jgi:hypothetical protein
VCPVVDPEHESTEVVVYGHFGEYPRCQERAVIKHATGFDVRQCTRSKHDVYGGGVHLVTLNGRLIVWPPSSASARPGGES